MYATYDTTIFGSSHRGRFPRRRHILRVGLYILLFVKEPSGPSRRKTGCSGWSWTNDCLICAKTSYPQFSTTCVRSLCSKASKAQKMMPGFTLSFGGLNGTLIERCSVTSARSWARGRWRGRERKTGQLLPAGRTELERRLQLLPTLRAKIDGHSARK